MRVRYGRLQLLTFALGLVKHDPADIFDVDEILIFKSADDRADDLLLNPNKNKSVYHQLL
jgi:hypothetical protein